LLGRELLNEYFHITQCCGTSAAFTALSLATDREPIGDPTQLTSKKHSMSVSCAMPHVLNAESVGRVDLSDQRPLSFLTQLCAIHEQLLAARS
jgi:hypothetical protein